MNEKLALPGTVCESTSGHDKGRRYIIVTDICNGFVELIDGKYRQHKSPKKKNIKHLKHLGFCEDIASKLSLNNATDEQIKRAIKIFKI